MTATPAAATVPLISVPVPPPVAGAPAGKAAVAWTAAAAPAGMFVGAAAAGVEGAADVSAVAVAPDLGVSLDVGVALDVVVALDVGEDKLELARALGAEAAIDARRPDAVAEVIEQTSGGAHGALVTAVSPAAFNQALGLVRRKGTISLVGLPPGNFETPIFDVVLKRITVRGSIVGTRADLAEAVQFAARRKVRACVRTAALDEINRVFDDLEAGRISGRAVLRMA